MDQRCSSIKMLKKTKTATSEYQKKVLSRLQNLEKKENGLASWGRGNRR